MPRTTNDLPPNGPPEKVFEDAMNGFVQHRPRDLPKPYRGRARCEWCHAEFGYYEGQITAEGVLCNECLARATVGQPPATPNP